MNELNSRSGHMSNNRIICTNSVPDFGSPVRWRTNFTPFHTYEYDIEPTTIVSAGTHTHTHGPPCERHETSVEPESTSPTKEELCVLFWRWFSTAAQGGSREEVSNGRVWLGQFRLLGVFSDLLPTERLTIVLTMACISLNRVYARAVQEKLYQLLVNKTIYQQTRHQYTAAGTICLTNRIANQLNSFNLRSGNKQVNAPRK